MFRKNYQTKVVKATKRGERYMSVLLNSYQSRIKGKIKMKVVDGMLAYTITTTDKDWTEIEDIIKEFVEKNGVEITVEG